VRKILKPDNILISRDDIDEFIKWDDVCLLLWLQIGQLLPENAILSDPLTVFTPTKLADLSEVPKFDVLLTDYGTGKLVSQDPWKCISCDLCSRVRRWISR